MTDAQSSAHASVRTGPPRAGVVHIRHRHESHFTVVGNHLAQHPDLSLVAIGIAVYIQSLPDGATVGIKDLTRRFREGEITIARALRELERAGYLERKRVRTEGGRVVTVTRWYERPGATDTGTNTSRKSAAPAAKRAPEQPLPPVDPPAAELLAGLRRRDPRLLLSAKDVRRLSPAVRAWLDRGVGTAQIVRTLSADLPVGAITWPARLLAHRLANWLPPVLPVPAAEPPKQRPLPLQTCDGCERAFRAERAGLCRDCRDGGHAAA
ncbi:helix-turn-helix domain-containing protein [Streptomyces morookaense]|uniref:Helix-turn-helix domain-containing protein n=1 Tax=Streptomyces morookaense TaxID=1970 RepID=A0A7Y7B5J5_STRMO|nr:helix-turn-helix domain-containing protein [Streptomyces morookaense]NVK79016.1 helix-turn-helix domain-containing protein [Streptomyces morookaense]